MRLSRLTLEGNETAIWRPSGGEIRSACTGNPKRRARAHKLHVNVIDIWVCALFSLPGECDFIAIRRHCRTILVARRTGKGNAPGGWARIFCVGREIEPTGN